MVDVERLAAAYERACGASDGAAREVAGSALAEGILALGVLGVVCADGRGYAVVFPRPEGGRRLVPFRPVARAGTYDLSSAAPLDDGVFRPLLLERGVGFVPVKLVERIIEAARAMGRVDAPTLACRVVREEDRPMALTGTEVKHVARQALGRPDEGADVLALELAAELDLGRTIEEAQARAALEIEEERAARAVEEACDAGLGTIGG